MTPISRCGTFLTTRRLTEEHRPVSTRGSRPRPSGVSARSLDSEEFNYTSRFTVLNASL